MNRALEQFEKMDGDYILVLRAPLKLKIEGYNLLAQYPSSTPKVADIIYEKGERNKI